MAGKLAGIVNEFRYPGHGNAVIEAPAGSQADVRPLLAGAKTDRALDRECQLASAQLGFERIGDCGACTCRLADAAIDAHQEMFPAGTRAIRDSWRRGDGSGIVGDKRDRHTAILYGDRYDAVTA